MSILVFLKKLANFLSMFIVFFIGSLILGKILFTLFGSSNIVFYSFNLFAIILLLIGSFILFTQKDDWIIDVEKLLVSISALVLTSVYVIEPILLEKLIDIKIIFLILIVLGSSFVYKQFYYKIISNLILKKEYNEDFTYQPDDIDTTSRMLSVYHQNWMKFKYKEKIMCKTISHRKKDDGIVFEIAFIKQDLSPVVILTKEAFVPIYN